MLFFNSPFIVNYNYIKNDTVMLGRVKVGTHPALFEARAVFNANAVFARKVRPQLIGKYHAVEEIFLAARRSTGYS